MHIILLTCTYTYTCPCICVRVRVRVPVPVRVCISMYNMRDVYDMPYSNPDFQKKWTPDKPDTDNYKI